MHQQCKTMKFKKQYFKQNIRSLHIESENVFFNVCICLLGGCFYQFKESFIILLNLWSEYSTQYISIQQTKWHFIISMYFVGYFPVKQIQIQRSEFCFEEFITIVLRALPITYVLTVEKALVNLKKLISCYTDLARGSMYEAYTNVMGHLILQCYNLPLLKSIKNAKKYKERHINCIEFRLRYIVVSVRENRDNKFSR